MWESVIKFQQMQSSRYGQTLSLQMWLTACSPIVGRLEYGLLSEHAHKHTYVCDSSQTPGIMKSTKVQNPRRILHILRSMPMRVHRACAGLGQKLYACALFIIDGLGHATWSSKMPVSRSGTAPF